MTPIRITPVQSKHEKRLFLTFPWSIYHDDPLWVPPLLPERAKTIDPQRGTFFQRGEAEFFIAWKGSQMAGTICTAEDKAVNRYRSKPDCMFGFFECVNDYEVAKAMFEHAATWAKKRKLETLYGPFNLDYEDAYGILIEGRDRPPALLCGHTPTYYQGFVEQYGFQPARGDNLAFAADLNLDTPAGKRLFRLADKVCQRSNITIRGADLEHWDEEVERVYVLINKALAHLPDFAPWQREALEATFKTLRPIADPELVLFAEVNNQVVGWFPGIPNLNEALHKANGLRYPWNYLQLLWTSRRQPKCLAIKSVLVLPEYWDTGVSVLLFAEMARRAAAKGYTWADLSLTSDDNPRTPILAEHMGAKIYKRYRVYRLLL
jgi:GNAT superfamily N-acetyltransferase